MDPDHATAKAAEYTVSIPTPVIVDLGKRSRKAVRKLKDGTGPLPAEVEHAIRQVAARLGDGDKDKQLVPVVIIYGQKRKRVGLPSFPFSPLNLLR